MTKTFTILIVEDEPDMQTALKIRLESIGFSILLASDGLEGFQMAKSHLPNLILLDIMLPKMDGFKVCQLLKLDNKYKQIPIVMLSARSSEQDLETGKRVGADFYLTKPFKTDDLLKIIRELMTKLR
ncbi:MAG: response regulator [Candidatus Marinimicrobia bacterium]|nr:response regulator [Candidatus Neomarinimicrobiota bacterium]